MAREIDLGPTALTLRYSGVHALTGLKRELRIPYERIERATLGADDVPSLFAWRVGLAEPFSRLRRGRFWSRGRKWFLDVADPRRAVVLRLRPGSEFDAVAVQADRPESLLAELLERLGRADREPPASTA
jgi:hypothetical protein